MTEKTRQFLDKLRESGHWNDEYDYSKVEYITGKNKVIVIDKNFNTEHLISPYNLLCGIKLGPRNIKNGYLSFEEARDFVRKMNLSKYEDWSTFIKTNKIPHNIPKTPAGVYKTKGWISWEDFIGTKPNFDGTYLSFEDARKFVRSLKLKSFSDWCSYIQKHKHVNIPRGVQTFYKNDGWVSMEDFLGTKIGFDGTYLPFEEARELVRGMGLNNGKELKKLIKSGELNIPITYYSFYKNDGWISTEDFLGTKIGFDGTYLSFEDARNYVRTLNLETSEDWLDYSKGNDKPNNIPADPRRTYKDCGWVSMRDWLGNNKLSNQDKNKLFLSFEESKKYVKNLGLKTYSEWRLYLKGNELPHNIPRTPSNVYKNCGWVSMRDWLGNDEMSHLDKDFYDYETAKQYVISLGIKSGSEWRVYKKNNPIPDYIPRTPESFYKDKGWISWGDFLGTDSVANRNREYLSFDEARNYVRKLNLKTSDEWKLFYKSDARPLNIPSNPKDVYGEEWISMGDWLGSGTIAPQNREYLSFEDARDYVRSLNLKFSSDWREYSKSGVRPDNIPSHPHIVYKDNWISIADWLGYFGDGTHQWTKKYVIDFIKSLEDELINLDSVELITIINSNNLAKKLREIGSLEDLIASQGGSQERRRLVRDIADRLENSSNDDTISDTVNDAVSEFEEELIEGDIDVIIEQEELEPLDPIQELHMYDNNMITASLDDENLDFLMKNQLKKLWNRVLNKKEIVEEFRLKTGNENFTIIKNWFFDEYEKVIQIESPSDYIFKYEPNLMQKLITYRLINEKRYGNWSGTGAGKTLSAIFAGRYAGAKNTLIVCNNATVEGWTNSIHEYFSNNRIYTKKFLDYTDPSLYTIVDKYDVNFKDGENNYLILNYETFQLEDSEYIVSELLKNNVIDYIILDEVQNVKQRDDNESSRRNVVSKLIIHAKEKNEELLVMAMSATPVINNLTEPKKLIELLTGEIHNELNTTENIINGIEMYKALTRHGLRYKPKYGITVNEEIIEIDGSDLAEQIIRIPRGAVVDFEKVLLNTKLEGIKDKIQKGTLIYTHYVTELSHLIGDYVKDLGFSIGYYTGEDKNGLRPFKEGKIDVLIGSAPIGTGVDGIQYVCNTLIPIVLPWTSSEYDQLKGRIDRQGSYFDHVNIYIPQVVIPIGEDIWSWDKRRHNIIRFKATLGDLAVDGVVPRNLLPSKAKLVEDAKKELADWVNRLQDGDMITFEREELMIPLNPQQIERHRNQLGDFSDMNKRWSVSRSDTTHDKLSTNPSEWYYYHTLYSEKRKSWSEIPYIEIAKKINGRPDWIVGDFGCGENLLSKEITNKVFAFDHVAIDDKVYACDIKNVPIEDGLLDVAVFSLALMGTNYSDYLKEAYRTLKTYGNIFVCEPASKWEGREEELRKQIESVGFKCFGAVKNTDRFIYIDGVKY